MHMTMWLWLGEMGSRSEQLELLRIIVINAWLFSQQLDLVSPFQLYFNPNLIVSQWQVRD